MLEITDRGIEGWNIKIVNEKWKFDDLQEAMKVLESLQVSLNFWVQYHSGFEEGKVTSVYIEIDNQIISAKDKRELHRLFKLLVDIKTGYGRWK